MNNSLTVVKVGIADLNTITSSQTIRTSGLGSCVGVVIYDLPSQIAGMAHIMLPDSNMTKSTQYNLAKYADTAIPKLIKLLLDAGAKKYALKAKLAGGAQMFPFSTSNQMMRIGPRNVEAVKQQLNMYRIPIVSEDCGGNNGRTIEFIPTTGVLQVRTVNKGVAEI